MRFNIKAFLVLIVAGGLVWFGIVLFHLQMDDYISRGPAGDVNFVETNKLMERIINLEKSVADQLKEDTLLLNSLRESLKLKKEQRKKEKFKEKDRNNVAKDKTDIVLPVLVMACNRITVSRCLDKLIQYRPSATTFPIIISQDCDHKPTYLEIQKYVNKTNNVQYIKQPDQSDFALLPKDKKFQGYYKISRHYKFALEKVLDDFGYDSVIIVEDDLEISVDFYEYFLGTYPLLKMDPTLWCISAWNDNGKSGLIDMSSPELLYRTDFFPGLGWLLQARHWRAFRGKWPRAFFDDWLRDSNQTGGLSCIRPEISRTSTFGKEGVSKGLYFDRHLKYIQLNKDFVPFTRMNLQYLLKNNYDTLLDQLLATATPMSIESIKHNDSPEINQVKVYYHDKNSFKKIARALGLMDDFRSGVARTIYNGVVTCFFKGRRVYILPETPFTGYDKSWS